MSTESDAAGLENRPVAEVDRIRDIIFGSQMRSYEQQFKRVASQLDLLSRQLQDLGAVVDQQQTTQESRTREVQQQMNQRFADLEGALAARMEQLDAKLDQQTSALRAESRKAVEELREDLSSRTEQQATALETQTRQLVADLRKQGQDLRTEFTAALDALDDDKTSRHNLGDLLLEMGTRLKQKAGVADLLEQVESLAEAPPAEQVIDPA